MKFGPVSTAQAVGCVLAHSLVAGKVRLKKGRVLDTEDVAVLEGEHIEEVVVACLEPGDIGEDRAAEALAEALDVPQIRAGRAATGRVNLFADTNGLFRADAEMVNRFNRIDPAITLATVADHSQVSAGEMVATIKIIPLAVSGQSLNAAQDVISKPGILALRPFQRARVGLVATTLPSLKQSVMDKTARLLQTRLDASGSVLAAEKRVRHDAAAVADAVSKIKSECDVIVAFGASAIVDGEDVIPAAIKLAGGAVDHVGMPVDPGNLLVLGHVGPVPVIGAPGCARSPKENGFDWVLARILAGETPSPETIMSMGVGGLLKEIPTRPQPRLKGEGVDKADLPVEIVVLAAGRASRMAGASKEDPPHKLLAEFDGVPLLRKSCQAALASKASAVTAIVGYRGEEMSSVLDGLEVTVVDNPDFEEGMASSLRRGVASLNERSAGALIMLADMPAVEASHLDTLISAFQNVGGEAVVRAASGQVRGNPVILPRSAFDAVMRLEGDTGARQIIAASGLRVVDVDIGDAALVDVDTRQAVIEAGGVLRN
ncbi:molybdopterin-binding/glycosyltransferase family 2 protein [Hoeflea prorocentri]|uniref:Molybdopterin-binding/glycosyltransferase family 2 protein n=1 Tax=Hoeflea prorocentri TaxID=1922333 RepID=A0A9X3ZG47_9HYPH|nr:molybdopterin-binding/glycosyltransferase family 2 protein [Hoeflea prorocentri]MDA5398182.1 molybdopterin-binding/glycosyltransferase family 2 protein [Hoeflea prorocentri]